MNAPLGLLLPVLVGLTASCAQPPVVIPPPASAEQAFVALEQRLLTAQQLRIGYRIEAEGAFTASLSGVLVLSGDTGVELAGAGTFGGAPVALRIVADEARMRGGNGQQRFDDPTPDHLRQALVLGLTRMGLLHNLARLSAGRSPDHAAGGVAEWVQPRAIEWLSPALNDEQAQTGLRFDIEVAGQDAGDAELWLDALDHPVRRRQTVRFPGGEMHVLEEYDVLRHRAED